MAKFDPNKSRKRRPVGETKELKKTFLIYCEGQTESEYFLYLKKEKRLTNVSIKIIELNENGNTLTLAKEAIQRKSELQKGYDEFWIVLDKDDTKDSDFESAINLCKENSIQVAYSIQAFEVWILFHFQYFEDKCERPLLIEKINSFMKPVKYGKSKEELHSTFKIIFPNLDVARKNAKTCAEKFENKKVSISERESSSTVYILVESLLEN
jgi:hypothetical protein